MRKNVPAAIPWPMVGDTSTLYEEFLSCAKKYGDNREYATQLLKFLPQAIKESCVWFDRVTSLWRYEYGIPYDNLPQDMVVVGTNMNHPVDDLYIAIKTADKWLKPEQLILYRERLADKNKHLDVVFEMRPLKDVKKKHKAKYEAIGMGTGKTTLDWQVNCRFVNIAFDVKNRIKSFIDHMTQIVPDLNKGEINISPSSPNPEDLFKSVECKLKNKSFFIQLQGVWIHTDIKEDKHKLTSYFCKNLDKRKIHFVIFSDWKNDATILARNRIITYVLKKIFGLTESSRFVAEDYR